MGLLKTVGNAVSNAVKNVGGAAGSAFVGATQDSFYREYFTSGNMAGNIIMKRGERIADGKKNSNANANDNIITSGALIDIQVNQCMIIVENGAIVEFSTEPGRYIFDNSTAPSVLCGTNKGLKPFAEEVKNRFINGGGRTSTQRIYFINLGKIWEPILWGTGSIPFRNCHKPGAHTNALIDYITLRGHGTCEIKVDNPLTFFCEIGSQLAGGDNNGIIRTEDAGIVKSTKTAINGAIAKAISAYSNEVEINHSQVGMYLDDITERINQQLTTTLGKKGFKVFEFLIDGSLQPSDEDVEKLNKSFEQYKEAAFFATNQQDMANYNLQKTHIKNFEGIGKNEGAGGAMGMMGVGFGMNAMGMGMGMGQGGIGNLQYTQPTPATPQTMGVVASTPTPLATWTCACGVQNAGKFCVECGSSKPDENNNQVSADLSWTCNCGHKNDGKFCSNCGSKKPAIKRYQCDKCGWKPEEGKTVRFCPECGDIFDDSDIVSE